MAVDPVSIGIQLGLMGLQTALTASQKIEGPRLDSTDVTTSSYGTPVDYFYGTRKLEGRPTFFAERLHEVKRRRKTKGGKYNEYTYYGTWASLVADHEIDAITRIWFDKHLVYDATGAGPISPFGADLLSKMRFYLGTADQDPDPRMVATVDAEQGAGSTPAYRGVAYVFFEEIPLEKVGNRLPQVDIEATANATDAYPYELRDSPIPLILHGFTYSPDFTRFIYNYGTDYAIWDVSARALMISGTHTLDPALGNQLIYGVGLDGTLYLAGGANGQAFISFPADGIGAPVTLYDSGLPVGFAFVRALAYGNDGFELICAPGFLDFNPRIIYVSAVGGFNALTYDLTGDTWYPRDYFLDLDGDIWAVGTSDGFIHFYRLTFENEDSPRYFKATAPSTTGTNPPVFAYHYADASVDHFVVAWNETAFLTIDRADGTVTHTQTGAHMDIGPGNAYQNVKPGAGSVFTGCGFGTFGHLVDEVSSVDLSILRTIDTNNYFGIVEATVYDPINHALICISGGGQLTWLYLDRVTGDGVTLRSIVEDVADRTGIDAADIDATALDQTVRGYSWVQGQGKAIVEPLLEFFDSEARPHDFTLQFIKRGGSVGAAIATGLMGAGGSKRYEITRTGDTDLPQRYDLTFADIAMDQQANTVQAQRPGATTDSARAQSLDLTTLVLSADEAMAGVQGLLRRKWYAAESYRTALTRGFSQLEPGDLRTLTLDDMSRSAKLTRLEFGANGVLSCEFERDAPGIHVTSALVGAPGDGFRDSLVVAVGYTKGFVLDIPLVTDSDDGLITYLLAAPYSDDVTWPGAIFYEGTDGITYDTELASLGSTQRATWGYASTELDDATPAVIDRGNTVTVIMQSGELTSCTEAEMLNGANAALLGDELIRFMTATLTGTDTYDLSGLVRGDRGTEQFTATHASGDRFVLLDARVRSTMGASDVNLTLYFRPITMGAPETSGFPTSLAPYSGASLKPYSVAHLAVEDVSGDKVATWVRRTRIGGAWRDGLDASLGESSEEYEADVLDAGGAVLRTYAGLSSPTVTYDAADQSSDGGLGVTLAVYQISTTVDRGFPATVAL